MNQNICTCLNSRIQSSGVRNMRSNWWNNQLFCGSVNEMAHLLVLQSQIRVWSVQLQQYRVHTQLQVQLQWGLTQSWLAFIFSYKYFCTYSYSSLFFLVPFSPTESDESIPTVTTGMNTNLSCVLRHHWFGHYLGWVTTQGDDLQTHWYYRTRRAKC